MRGFRAVTGLWLSVLMLLVSLHMPMHTYAWHGPANTFSVSTTLGASPPTFPAEPITGSAVDFYRYDSPVRYSSNTGREECDTAIVMFLRDSNNATNLVVIFDQADDGKGGKVRLELSHVSGVIPSGAEAPNVKFLDDPNPVYGDRFEWNVMSQYGTATMKWPECCTDGFVFGPLPEVNHSSTHHTASYTDALLPGLFGTYYNNVDFTGPNSSRIDTTIDFYWGYDAPEDTAIVHPNTFSIRWTGYYKARCTGKHKFTVEYDDGAYLKLNNVVLANDMTTTGYGTHSGEITLTAGQKYPIELKHIERSNRAQVKLYHHLPKDCVPTDVGHTHLSLNQVDDEIDEIDDVRPTSSRRLLWRRRRRRTSSEYKEKEIINGLYLFNSYVNADDPRCYRLRIYDDGTENLRRLVHLAYVNGGTVRYGPYTISTQNDTFFYICVHTPEPEPSPSPSASVSPGPSGSPTGTPTPSGSPTSSPGPSGSPGASPSASPTSTGSPVPSGSPSTSPGPNNSPGPSSSPSGSPGPSGSPSTSPWG